MKLTDEQRRFAEENHNLIYKFIQKQGLDVDDWYGVIAIGYVKSVAGYSPERSAFSTYAFTCMRNEMLMEYRTKSIPTISLDEVITKNDSDSGLSRSDFIPDGKCLEADSIFLDSIGSVIGSLPERTQKILYLKSCGYTGRQIAKILSISQPHVSRIIRSCKVKFENL